MDPWNHRIDQFEKMFGKDALRAFRERVFVLTRARSIIPRVFSMFDDRDQDDAPDALVGARVRPRRPLGGSAIALPEPDEDLTADAVALSRREA